MIKFFRRIRQRLLTENKFSKYLVYAVGEIGLVMIGILLALQVNEWNNERNRNIAEQAIIEQLNADLIQSRLEIEEMERFFLRQARFSAAMSRAFWNAELREDAKNFVYGAWSNRIYSPTMGTARSLINSGKIDLLSSAELKNDIVSYVERVDYLLKDISRYEETYYRKGVELLKEVIPNTFESIADINGRTYESSRFYKLNLHGRPLEIDRVPFQSDWDELFEDERLFRAYEALRLSHRNIYFRYGNMLEITNELLTKVNRANDPLAPD